MNILQRIKGFLIGEDEAFNALGGGSYRQTISGTVGRALIAGEKWAVPIATILDFIFGNNHCIDQANQEK